MSQYNKNKIYPRKQQTNQTDQAQSQTRMTESGTEITTDDQQPPTRTAGTRTRIPNASQITTPSYSGLPVTKIRLKGIPNTRNSDGGIQQTTKITIIGAGIRQQPSNVPVYGGAINKCKASCATSKHRPVNQDGSRPATMIQVPSRNFRRIETPGNRICSAVCSSGQSKIQSAPSSQQGARFYPASTVQQANQVDSILNNPVAYSQRVFTASRPASGVVAYAQAVQKETVDPVDLQKKKVRIERQLRASPYGTIYKKTYSMNQQQPKQQQQQQKQPLPPKYKETANAMLGGDLLSTSYIPTSSKDATVDEIKILIDEERRDVLQSQILSPEIATKLKYLKKKTLLEETLRESIPTSLGDGVGDDDGDDSRKSDVVASLMHSEECGVISTTSSPKRTYNALFGVVGALQVALDDERSVAVSPAAPAPLHDIVVPVGEATQDNVAVVIEELEQQVAQTDQEIPKADAYSESVQQGQQSPQVTVIKKRESPRKDGTSDTEDIKFIPRGELEEEKAPWDIDLGSLEDLVGGQLSILSTGEHLPSDESIRATLGRFEYILDVEKPKHYSCIQLRGTQRPSWFPGYYFVRPELVNPLRLAKSSTTDNYIKLEHDPSKAFTQIWNIFKPNNLQENSEIVLL